MRVLMLVGICLVIALVAFGENPLRKFQREQRELMEKRGTDELSVVTNLYIEQKQKKGFSGMFGGDESAPTSESGMINSIKSSANSNLIGDGSDISSAVKVAKPDEEFPEDNYVSVGVSNKLDSMGNQKPEKTNDYYPPIAGKSVAASVSQKPMVLTGKEPRLRSGQMIAFEGTSVFLVDQNGNRSIMPDGTYNLQDGGSLIVNNGRSMLK